MTVKTAFKYIFIGLLTCFLLLVGYVVQAGIAIVHAQNPRHPIVGSSASCVGIDCRDV